MTAPAETEPAPGKSSWRLAAALLLVLLALAGLSAWPRDQAERAIAPGHDQWVWVRLVRPDQPEAEEAVDWTEGLTVRQATETAYPSSWRGQGPMAFLDSLDGSPNQGPDGLNWQFEVNGEYATRGAGAVTLRPGDRVLWKLAPYE